MYKGALLDLDDTLFPTSFYVAQALRASINSMVRTGLPTTSDEGLERLLRIRRETGTNSGHHFDLLVQSYGLYPTKQRIVQAGVAAYHSQREKLLVPQQETTDFLDTLAKEDFRSAVVTTGLDNKQWFKLVKMEIVPYFIEMHDDGAISERVYVLPDGADGSRKELITRVIDENAIDSSRSFVVDDKTKWIVAGKEAGIKYGFRIKRGVHQDESYPDDVPSRYKEDDQIGNLYDLVKVLKKIRLMKSAH